MRIKNGQAIKTSDIEVLSYPAFYDSVLGLLNSETRHCLSYFAKPEGAYVRLYAIIALDELGGAR